MDQDLNGGPKGQSRSAPHSPEAEMSVLGAMLLDASVAPRVVERVDGSCFFHPAHRRIFEAIVGLADAGQPVDLVTLTEALKAAGSLEAVGGAAYLTTLINYLPTTAHLDSYLTIVAEKAVVRSLISSATAIVTSCYQEGGDTGGLLDEAERVIFGITQRRVKGEIRPMKELVKEAMERVELMQQAGGLLTGVPTGFKDLDNITCGLHPSDLIVLAGRPSMGKTALALTIAEHAALKDTKDKKAVGIFSLEMSREQLVFRMLCSRARVNAQNLRRGFLGQKDHAKLVQAASHLAEAPIYIDDTPAQSTLDIRARARSLKAKFDVQLLVIDYLQLIVSPIHRPDSRQQEVSDISRALKSLARELKIPVLVLSQLNRAVESRNDKRPVLADLRESGAIEQDADLVLLIMRPAAYPDLLDGAEDKGALRNLVYVNVAKQRNGPTGEHKLTFLEEYTRFEDYAEFAPEGA